MAKHTVPTTPQTSPTWDRTESRSPRTQSGVLGSQMSSVTGWHAPVNGVVTNFFSLNVADVMYHPLYIRQLKRVA